MNFKCAICSDTGEASNSGYLDCVHCDAATDRAMLEEWYAKHPRLTAYDQRWVVFQYAMRLCEEKIAAQSIVVGVQKRRKGDL